MKKLLIILILLIGCTKADVVMDPTSILESRVWISYRYVFESNEYDDLLLKDKYLSSSSGSFFQSGDSVEIYIKFKLTFYNNDTMDFGTIRTRQFKCAGCDHFIPLDTFNTHITKKYYAKNTFVILADSTGWNPYYYQAEYIDHNNVKFDKCYSLYDVSSGRTRSFDTVPLTKGKVYWVDIYMKPIE